MTNDYIVLDVGCGPYKKHKGFVGIDKREQEGVDIVWDLEVFPYPIEDEKCKIVIVSHIFEHIKPWLSIDFLDELWRVTTVGGKIVIEVPYAGTDKFWKDPTHCNGCTEETFHYFDPSYGLYGYYKPKPWKLYPDFPQREGDYLVVFMEKILAE